MNIPKKWKGPSWGLALGCAISALIALLKEIFGDDSPSIIRAVLYFVFFAAFVFWTVDNLHDRWKRNRVGSQGQAPS